MLKKILLSSMLSIVATGAFAVSSTVTSKDYVDDLVATKQVKIPAAGATGVGAGETIITYTGAAGTIGERGIYNDASSYDATTDADKIITASALRGAVSNISTTTTSKLTCYDNDCTLWNIGTQTAYGIDAATAIMAMLNVLVDTNGTGTCYKRLSDGTVTAGTCINQPTNYGDWGVTFTYNGETVQINGISVCSSIDFNGGYVVSNNQVQVAVQSEYESAIANAPTTSPVGNHCYCKVTDPIGNTSWVSEGVYTNGPSYCAHSCAATGCSSLFRRDSQFRRAAFGLN